MSYIPNTPGEREELLLALGKRTMTDLFAAIPPQLRLKHPLALPQGKSEMETEAVFARLAQTNTVYTTCLRGAGAYRHFIPGVVRQLCAREEFVTAYTPYQAELSQGVLQAVFEYQSCICALTGMEVSNAGVYDGAHAAAEAAAMFRSRTREKTLISAAVKPAVLEVVRCYCAAAGAELEVIPAENGVTSLPALQNALDDETASVYLEQPNYYGLAEDAAAAAQLIHGAGAKLILGCNPTALAILKSPAGYGADAAVGEAQSLGLPLSFGGPYLGYMAVKTADMRKLPGRIVGQTQDAQGRRAFVLTLQAREQHIRREKASSSICSNQALCALTAAVYCACMGKQGLKDVAEQSHAKACYAAAAFSAAPGFSLRFDGFFFHEFVTRCPADPVRLEEWFAREGILCGLPIIVEGESCLLWCVTECVSKAEIDRSAQLLREAAQWN